MRIAVVHNLPAGGAMRVLYEQVSRLAKNHQIDLYTLSTSGSSFFPLKNIVSKYIEIDYHYPEHFPFTVISIYKHLKKAYRKLAEMINSKNYDLAYVFPCFLTQAPYILRYLKIPKIYFCPEPKREFYEPIPRAANHLTYYLTLPFRKFIKNIDYKNTRQADLVLTLSRYNKTNIDKIYGIKSTVIPLGVNSDTFYPLEIEKENQIICIGNFNLLKGHDFTIRSVAVIPEKIRPRLVIAGFGGSEKKYLQNLAGGLNVDLSCFDSPSDRELNLLYNRSKLFVFTAIKEPFGLVVLEAWACGLKLLAVNDGGVPELVTQKFLGSLLDRREKLFSRAIVNELSNKEDKKILMLRRQYVIKNWDWQNSVDYLVKYLKAAAKI